MLSRGCVLGNSTTHFSHDDHRARQRHKHSQPRKARAGALMAHHPAWVGHHTGGSRSRPSTRAHNGEKAVGGPTALFTPTLLQQNSVDDLKTSQSVVGQVCLNFETFDARIASALKKLIQNSNFKKKVHLNDKKAQKEDRFFRVHPRIL